MSYNYLSHLTLLFVFLAQTAFASDLAREQRIAEQIEDSILDGDVVWIEADNSKFISILMDAQTDKQKGAVILLHGSGANPNWPDIIYPLRTQLTEFGWTTLSLQMPVASADAKDSEWNAIIPEAFPRISKAIEQLQQKGISNIILLGHSFGAQMAIEYTSSSNAKPIQALVVIGLSSGKQSTAMESLRKINIPTLDVWGSDDMRSVIQSARWRQTTMHSRAEKPVYRQIEVAGADHMFAGSDNILLSHVKSWIHKNAMGTEQAR